MTLCGDELEDFKKTYENAFDARLSDEDAQELAEQLKHLYRTVIRRSTPIEEEPRSIHPPWQSSSPQMPSFDREISSSDSEV